MTKEDILNRTTWNEYGQGHCPIYVNLFEKKIPFIFFQKHQPKPKITDKMTDIVNEILTLNKTNLNVIKELLYEECLFSFQVADYGCEAKDGETDLEAHFREFEIANKDDAYDKSEVSQIQIKQEYDELDGRYSEIKINTATDELISVIVKNGKIIDFDFDGCTLSVFDKDEQQAKKYRHKTLK
ncbi:hypothetical protein [Winogradskyella sp. SM1960]|uniref:hypothetical protein n=1 Tax=Winogradskyella sp. SM1960 TaxID=2865955 RepID=UPI001CD685B7|nr:hypothetical protein [Winogradskyella sp. SM1960]